MLFPVRLRECRKSFNLNQGDFIRLFSVAQNTVSSWERGRSEPDYITLCKLCDYFDVTADYLLGRD